MSNEIEIDGDGGGETPAERAESGWHIFDGQGVLVQLRDPWVGVTHPNEPVVTRDDTGKITGVSTVPFLRGILRVLPDVVGPNGRRDVVFVIETSDPNQQRPGKVFILVPREQIAYISKTEPQLISTP